jgi:hypothetical protein
MASRGVSENMKLRKIVLLWALAAPVVAWSQTDPTVASGGNLHYVGAGITTWGNGDIGAQINAAYAALPARGGTIVVIGPGNGACYNFITPIVAAVPGKYLLLQGGALASHVARPSVPVCLNFMQTNSSVAITLDYVPSGEAASIVTHGIQNLTLINNQCERIGGCDSNATGISFGGGNGGASGATFAGLKVIGFGTGLGVGGSTSRNGNLTFRDCVISYNTTGFLDTDSDGGHISFDACHFHGNATAVSSTASLRISNSWMESNTVLGVNCSSPAACDINSDHFENAEADSTHFLAGNGVFSVLGGDMRDNRTNGNTDWWMNFAGASFFVLGTALTSAGRIADRVIVNVTEGTVFLQNNSPSSLKRPYSNVQLVHLNSSSRTVSATNDPVVHSSSHHVTFVESADGNATAASSQPVADAAKNAVNTAQSQRDTSKNRGDVRTVDGTSFTSIDAAVSDCGSGPCTVIIPPAYVGAESADLVTSSGGYTYYAGPPNVTIIDNREIEASGGKNYPITYGGRNFGQLGRFGVTQNCASAKDSCVGATLTNLVSGTLPSNSGTQTGAVSVIATTGTVKVGKSTARVAAHEGYVSLEATSADAPLVDVRGFTSSVNVDRMTSKQSVITASGFTASTHTNISTAGAKIANAYGFDAQTQNVGTARNYGYHNSGNWLTENDSAWDVVDAGGTIRRAVLWRPDNGIDYAPLADPKGWDWKTQGGTGLFHVGSTEIVSRIAHSFSTSLSIAGGTPLTTSNQSGSGELCMTTGCGLITPILTDARGSLNGPKISNPVINGVSQGTGIQGTDSKLLTSGNVSGVGNPLCLDANGGATTSGCGAGILKVARSTPSCTTGKNPFSSCTSTLIWPVPFLDANYSVTCTGIGPSDLRAGLTVAGRSATNVVVNVVTYGSVGVSFSEIDCTGVSGMGTAPLSQGVAARPNLPLNLPIRTGPISFRPLEQASKTEPN